jgi:hypothetical protein
VVFAAFNLPDFIRWLLTFEVHVAFNNFEFTISSIKPNWFLEHHKVIWVILFEVAENLFHVFS